MLVMPQGAGTGEKPNVLVEKALFPTAHSAANHPWFGVLVMPEVMREVATAIAKNPDGLEDPESWLYRWAEFIKVLGVDAPVTTEDEEAAEDWADRLVEKFAARGTFRHHLAQAEAEMNGDQR